MKAVVRVALVAVGLFNVAIGLGFLVDPVKLSAAFALTPVGIQGLATIRADFPAFFLTGAAFALYGAWRADPRPLIVPLALLGIAFTGRVVSITVDGIVPTTAPPMIAEAAMIAVLLLARRVLARP